MIAKKKILVLSIIFAVLIIDFGVFQSDFSLAFSFAAANKTYPIKIKVIGMAKFVLRGTVTAVSGDKLTIHITNTSKNAKLFDNRDETLKVTAKTIITKNGKNITLNKVKAGNKVKVFGIFDKKTGSITVVQWIKVVSK